ncbi:hypothetical protein RBB78_03295 [Tunturiibacter empetritectus]|uniref:hypothetical protein n=1 Tax=Tunturiibacter empetritectus TaxID=3069691 RepID=UPI003D9B8BEF
MAAFLAGAFFAAAFFAGAFFAAFLVAKVVPLFFSFLLLAVPLLPAAFLGATLPPRRALTFFAADFDLAAAFFGAAFFARTFSLRTSLPQPS